MGIILVGFGNIFEVGVVIFGVVCDVNGEMFIGDVEIDGIMFILVNCLQSDFIL